MTVRARRRLAGGAALLLALAGCRSAGPVADGPTRTYRVGEPDAALDAQAWVRDETGVDVTLVVEPASLTFRPAGDSLEAVLDWTLRVAGPGPAAFAEGADTLRAATVEDARAAPPWVHTERVRRPPGGYRVEATVTDVGADRTARRSETVTVWAEDGGPWLSGPRLVRAGRPVVATRVPALQDSVRVVAQALAAGGGALVTTVARLRADTTVAAPLGAATPPPGSLAALGVDAAVADTVFVGRRPVAAGGVLAVDAPLPALAPGVYALRLALTDADGRTTAASSRRVVVRRRDFPLVTRLGDLVAPLVYLADGAEHAALRRGGRRAFDAFWGERIDDRRRAADALRAFYGRVEEANRLFSNHEPGWATDRGRVYVLFGPPDDVRATAEAETWTYRRGAAAPPQVVFDRTAGRFGADSPFAVFTLRRDRRYEGAERAAREAWRAGRVR